MALTWRGVQQAQRRLVARHVPRDGRLALLRHLAVPALGVDAARLAVVNLKGGGWRRESGI